MDYPAVLRNAGVGVASYAGWWTRGLRDVVFRPVGIFLTVEVVDPGVAVERLDANAVVEEDGTWVVVAGDATRPCGLGPQDCLDLVMQGLHPIGRWRTNNDLVDPAGHFFAVTVHPGALSHDAVVRGFRALCVAHRWNGQRLVTHAEWCGENDPYDCRSLRRELAS